MARVTIEDCLKQVDNRFDLVLKASKRARMLEMGEAEPMVPVNNDKPTVLALREIAEGLDISRSYHNAESQLDMTQMPLSEEDELAALLSAVDSDLSADLTEELAGAVSEFADDLQIQGPAYEENAKKDQAPSQEPGLEPESQEKD